MSSRTLELQSLYKSEAGYADLFRMLQAHPPTLEVMERITTVAQLLLLRCTEGHQGECCALEASYCPDCRYVCVVNTHLFFHWLAPHIRLMQVRTGVASFVRALLSSFVWYVIMPEISPNMFRSTCS